MRKLQQGEKAWVALVAGVASYEVLCSKGQTLSESLDGHLEKPFRRAMITGMIGMTALHLCNLLPPQIDPYHQLTRFKP